jgi:O-antigen ligase
MGRRRPKLVSTIIASILVATTAVLILGIGSGILETIGKDPTLTDRTAVWSTIIPLTTSPIVGTGFESFWLGPRLDKIWSVWDWQPNEAHNGWVETYVNLGWVGVCLLAVVLFEGYRAVFSRWRKGLPASSLMLTYFVVGLVYNFTEAAFFRMMTPVWIFLLLSMTPAALPAPAVSALEARRSRIIRSRAQDDTVEGWLA